MVRAGPCLSCVGPLGDPGPAPSLRLLGRALWVDGVGGEYVPDVRVGQGPVPGSSMMIFS